MPESALMLIFIQFGGLDILGIMGHAFFILEFGETGQHPKREGETLPHIMLAH